MLKLDALRWNTCRGFLWTAGEYRCIFFTHATAIWSISFAWIQNRKLNLESKFSCSKVAQCFVSKQRPDVGLLISELVSLLKILFHLFFQWILNLIPVKKKKQFNFWTKLQILKIPCTFSTLNLIYDHLVYVGIVQFCISYWVGEKWREWRGAQQFLIPKPVFSYIVPQVCL